LCSVKLRSDTREAVSINALLKATRDNPDMTSGKQVCEFPPFSLPKWQSIQQLSVSITDMRSGLPHPS
jgi:hypothetical protein